MPAGKAEKGEKIIFPMPGMALNSNEGGPETWRDRQLISTHAHAHTCTRPPFSSSLYPITLPQSLIYFEYQPSNVLILRFQHRGWWIMEDYQSENDSICLNCAEPHSAIIPEKSIVLNPGQSLLLWGLHSHYDTERHFHDDFQMSFTTLPFRLDHSVYTVVLNVFIAILSLVSLMKDLNSGFCYFYRLIFLFYFRFSYIFICIISISGSRC